MTVQHGVDVAIQTDGNWQDDRLRKYRRMKRKILEFIAKHKSAQLSVDRANRKVQALKKEKKRLMQAKSNDSQATNGDAMETSQDDEDEEIEEADIEGAGVEDEDEEDQLLDEDEEMVKVEPAPKLKRAASSRRKPIEVPRDENGSVILPFQIASLNVLELGKVVYDRTSFHSERYIWPVGYCVERTYMSMVDPRNQTTYTCKVQDGGETPLFTIRAADAPDEEMSARTPTGAWALVIKRANEVRHRESANAISGPEYYGFSNPLVIEMVEGLPDVDKCVNYRVRTKA
ncbi:F/Y-rich N-terminus-domain-containing protein [Zychaea mexicana]|uniref:F/Y-rich N-terminus-domain-containing protein n=1 Tax=Zychaea mexicana TaxID=64656 RepID=UPI0022FE2427|nr:F/Y-rich N-terminus-domain-containing protein [Zychaea mexicana]KAI9497554.1 F/Y-rich N-terminus-domain-containing protein [Zychaea mexicana]